MRADTQKARWTSPGFLSIAPRQLPYCNEKRGEQSDGAQTKPGTPQGGIIRPHRSYDV